MRNFTDAVALSAYIINRLQVHGGLKNERSHSIIVTRELPINNYGINLCPFIYNYDNFDGLYYKTFPGI